jgi:hypothetical protein
VHSRSQPGMGLPSAPAGKSATQEACTCLLLFTALVLGIKHQRWSCWQPRKTPEPAWALTGVQGHMRKRRNAHKRAAGPPAPCSAATYTSWLVAVTLLRTSGAAFGRQLRAEAATGGAHREQERRPTAHASVCRTCAWSATAPCAQGPLRWGSAEARAFSAPWVSGEDWTRALQFPLHGAVTSASDHCAAAALALAAQALQRP